ncbi:transcriptional regulator [Microbacterium soli]|uniref:Transcriptional regulator n=1 Tax=Microbacterium soli TaxID=446075 RepID=A0ABP7NBY3_9MICO
MAEPRFDELIHAPLRLRICAIAASASSVEFGELLSRLEVSKSALSKHVSQLVHVGYLEETPVTRDGRARLSLSLTPAGRTAYRGHIQALEQITGLHPQAS